MNNVMLDHLPDEWNGYRLNTDFRIGIQISIIQEDAELTQREKLRIITELLFGNEDGTIRPIPNDLEECLKWYLGGWFLDNNVGGKNEKKKLMDYDIDQWRIYADFMSIYHIDLSIVDMHWWKFQGLLWNMPHEQSSFSQCLELRQKKPRKGASAEERQAIQLAHARYDLDTKKKEFTEEEANAIDDFDLMMEQIKKNKAQRKEIENLLKSK